MPNKITLSEEQSNATEPTVNVIVQANAGTGKTFVLVQRLLRILFREFSDQKDETAAGILCLTYTNAGAAEMRNRILGAVMEWARADNETLRELLHGIAHNNPPTDEDLDHARQIFYNLIDNPHILKIQTIHSFCEDILRRFPIEANVPSAWRLVSGAEQHRLLKETFTELMNRPTSKAVLDAFDNILERISEHLMDGLLESILGQYRHIISLKQNANFPNYIIEGTRNFLNISKPPLKPDFDGDFEQILTKTGEIRKKLSPELQAVAEDVYEYNQYQKNTEIMRISEDFLMLCNGFADRYIALKNRRGLLDFDDILHKTRLLFENPIVMGTVLKQLDVSLKHILVDESQDNSPVMWNIIFSMLDNFWTVGEKENPRSLFVVGDIKQSIFSFQGANPDEFAEVPNRIGTIADNDQRRYQTVPLLESRRTTESVLNVVDYFFNNAKVAGFPKQIAHKCWRRGDAGLVEINPLFEKANGLGTDDTISEELEITRKKYAKHVADKIENLVKNENIPESDIMVLVQRREPFASLLSRELKRKNIATAGSDRIVLPNFPAIRDLLNLVRFVLDNGNDAALAFVLRSPLFRFQEREIFELCANRDLNRPLFETLREKRADIYNEILEIAALSNLAPYSFFSEIMRRKRADIIRALGRSVIEPLDEFMTLALSFERTKSGGLLGFLRWFLDGENEIKRDMEKGAGVRILTTHSSKGLEAPVVFLIDTTKNPKSQTKQRPFNVLNPEKDVFLCKSGDITSKRFDAAKDIDLLHRTEEYWRLFYVAMTRARDRLYVFGCEEGSRAESWHSKLYETVHDMPGAIVSEYGIITVSNPQTVPLKNAKKDIKKAEMTFATSSYNQLNELKINKSNNTTRTYQKKSILQYVHTKYGLKHGTDVHKKLQFLDINSNDDMAVKIKQSQDIARFWETGSRAEVPLAGILDGQFYSLRIDRMIETPAKIEFLDYKTDTTRERRDEYIIQMKKYAMLLSRIYPNKKIMGHILWLHDWELEKITSC